MKVLFVSSGNSENFETTPFIRTQGESLEKAGIKITYFPIYGKGLLGYLKASRKLRSHLKKYKYDVIHAHYSLSACSAVLAFPTQPIVLSLMGTDAYGEYIGVNTIKYSSRYLTVLTKIIQPFVSVIICKSEHIESYVYKKNKSHVIPNGILLENFHYLPDGYRRELGLAPEKKYILFLGNKKSVRKNFQLLEKAFQHLDNEKPDIISPFPISHDDVIKYLNSVDCLVVPSLMEGSPNVVKEAMACNCPIVATNVGDIAWLFGDEPGHFLTDFTPEDVAEKIKMALEFSEKNGRTNGRERIIELGLDAETVAQKIIAVYKSVLKNGK